MQLINGGIPLLFTVSLDEMFVVIATIIISVLFAFFYHSWKRRLLLPAGPRGLPVIGNLHMLGKQPYKSLKKLAEKHGPIMFLRLGSVPTVVVSDREAAKLFLKTYDHAFASRPNKLAGRCMFYNNQNIAFNEYGAEWRNLRKICISEVLNAKRVEAFRAVREEKALLMIQDIWRQQSHKEGLKNSMVNLTEALFTYSYNCLWGSIARKTFGDMAGEMSHVLSQFSNLLFHGSISDYIPCLGWVEFGATQKKMMQLFEKYDGFANKVLQEHLDTAKPSSEDMKSFVDLLLEISRKDSSFTHQHVKAILLDMFLGGTDTMGGAMEWATSLLLKHPHCILALQEEIDHTVGENHQISEKDLPKLKYLHCVVKEALRLYPPGPITLPHESTKTVKVDGYVIPKGATLLVNIWAIGRDNKVWEDAEDFKPERFAENYDEDFTGWSDFKSIPFGAGRRSCPGVNMAIPTLMLGLARLFHALDVTVEGDPAQLDMTEKIALSISRENPLFVHVNPRLPACKAYLEV